MICSVWDWHRLEYDYYSCPEPVLLGGWKPLTGLGIRQGGNLTENSHPVGIDIEDALPDLPPNCKLVGKGTIAKGQVCIIRNKATLGQTTATIDGRHCNVKVRPNAFGLIALGTAVGIMTHGKPVIPMLALGTSIFVAGMAYGEASED
jgi:hypothetical protein